MSDFINTIDLLGDETVIDSIINRTITEFKDDKITKIGNYAFQGCNNLATVVFPKVTTIGANSFYQCSSLSSFNGQNITTIGDAAFGQCSSLSTVSFPKVTKINRGIFNSSGLKKITPDTFPNVTSVGYLYTSGIFQNCTKLESIDWPNLTRLEDGRAFAGCTGLKSINLPNFLPGGFASHMTFANCTSLTSVCLPKALEIITQMFQGCTSLALFDLPVATSINGSGFNECSALATLILRNNAVCSLSSAISATKIAKGTGYIYVPKALVDSYKAATNWSTYATQFRALEDFTVDGTTTGELATIYDITNQLVRVTTSNTANGITENRSYTTTLTSTNTNPVENVTITMGGVDITTDVYNAETGEISIPAVTGDVVISASAQYDGNTIYPPIIIEQGNITWGSNNEVDSSQDIRTDFIEFTSGAKISIPEVSDSTYQVSYRAFDANFVYKASASAWLKLPGTLSVNYPYLRLVIQRVDGSAITVDELTGCTLTVGANSYTLVNG